MLFLGKDIVMKKIIALILVLALSFCFAGCEVINKVKGKIHEWKTGEDFEQVEKYEKGLELIASGDYEAAYAIFNELGDFRDSKDILARFRYLPVYATARVSGESDGELIEQYLLCTTVLNEKGMPTNLTLTMRANGEVIQSESFDFAYDSQGRYIKYVDTWEDGSSSYEYSYDDDHNVIQMIYTSSSGKRSITNYSYEDGNLVKSEYIPADGSPYTITYLYDSKDNLSIKSCSYSDGSVSSYTYTYDSEGNMTKEVYTTSNGGTVSHQSETNCYYDTRGNLIKKTRTEYGTKYTTDFTYDTGGNLIKEVHTTTSESDSYSYMSEYTYDSKGNLTQEKYTSISGSVSTTTYKYDANGNVTECVELDDDGYRYAMSLTYDKNGNVVSMHLEDNEMQGDCEVEYRLIFMPDGMTEDMYDEISAILDVLDIEE